MSKKEKILLKASIVFAAVFAIVPAANAMHIMEGYLPAKYCVAWGVVCLPFLIAGFISLKKAPTFVGAFFWCARRDLNPHVRNAH